MSQVWNNSIPDFPGVNDKIHHCINYLPFFQNHNKSYQFLAKFDQFFVSSFILYSFHLTKLMKNLVKLRQKIIWYAGRPKNKIPSFSVLYSFVFLFLVFCKSYGANFACKYNCEFLARMYPWLVHNYWCWICQNRAKVKYMMSNQACLNLLNLFSGFCRCTLSGQIRLADILDSHDFHFVLESQLLFECTNH